MYYTWKPYVPVAERRRNAMRALASKRKKGETAHPVVIEGRRIANTVWGLAWCENLERYSDYSNRLPRGKSYVRNGSVIDLQISPGQVRAVVVGSEVYDVQVTIARLTKTRWSALRANCAGAVATLVDLLQGRLSAAVMKRMCRAGDGLFPAPKDIKLACSCPDWATMCKHVAAVLYGVGARLDTAPELLFTLRQVDATDMVAGAGADIAIAAAKPGSGRVLEDAGLAELFGIELATGEAATKRRAGRRTTASPAKARKGGTPRKLAVGRRTPAGQSPTTDTVAPAAAVRTKRAATRTGKATSSVTRKTARAGKGRAGTAGSKAAKGGKSRGR